MSSNGSKALRITAVSLKNFLGIEEREYKLGKLTKVSGRNASMKTSIVEGLFAGLSGGDITRYKRVGSDGEAEIGLVINDGEYLLNRKAKTLTVKRRVRDTAAYEVVKRPQAFVDDFFDAKLSNPIRFDRAAAGERVDMLLEVMADGVTADDIKAAIGAALWSDHVDVIAKAGGHPLQVLDRIREALYDKRRGLNVSERDKRSSVQQLRETIPAEIVEGTAGAEISGLEKDRDEIQDRVSGVKAQAESAYRAAMSEGHAAHEKIETAERGGFKAAAGRIKNAAAEKVRGLEAEAEQKIAAIRAQLATDSAALREAAQADVDSINDAAVKRIDESGERLEIVRFEADTKRTAQLEQVAEDVLQLDRATQRLATARANAEQVMRFQTIKDQADRFEQEADSLMGQSVQLSGGILAVDSLKAKLLERIPIKGLTVDGRDIRINGVLYDQTNQGERLKLAARFAALRAERHPLRIVFMDGAEALDEDNRQALYVELVDKLDMQVIASVVERHDLEIETSERAAATA